MDTLLGSGHMSSSLVGGSLESASPVAPAATPGFLLAGEPLPRIHLGGARRRSRNAVGSSEDQSGIYAARRYWRIRPARGTVPS